MRPETLTFAGLSSYTHQETIDFTGKNFIAVVGDTGAGKSTILEAICYALYNRCTYASSISPLIADGGDGTISVEFTFTVGKRRWRVSRSASQHTPTSVHRLTCLDTGVLTTGARQVNAEIRRTVGLDCDTFLRAVVLPQGRFQELLQMNGRGRAQVLDSVLGLEQLGQVRDHAKKLQLRLNDRLTEYRLHRRRFLDDPAAALATASDLHRERLKHLQQLEEARTAIVGSRASQRQAATEAGKLAVVKDALSAAIPAGAADQLRTLAVHSHTLDVQRNDINQLAGQLRIEQDLLREQVAHAEQDGGTVSGTAATISTLAYLGEQIPQQHRRARHLAKTSGELAGEKTKLQQLKQTVADLEPSVIAADKTLTDAEAALARARARKDVAVEKLRIWRQTAADLQKAHDEFSRLEEALGAAQGKASDAKGIADRAEGEREQNEHAHDALRKANAAAHSAAELEPGMACLICDRPLPADFTPPAAPDLTAADISHKNARVHAEKTGRAAAVAAAQVKTLQDDDLPAARRSVAETKNLLAAALRDLQEAVADADLVGTDEQILKRVTDSAAAADNDVRRTAKDRDDTHRVATSAKAEFDIRSQAHATRVAELQEQQREHLAVGQAIDEAASGLPQRFALAAPVDIGEVQRQKTAAEAHQHHLQQLTARQAATVEALTGLRERSTALEKAYTKTITKPAVELREKLMTLAQRVADATAAVGLDRPAPIPAADTDLATQAQWAADLLAYTQTTFDVCAATISDYQQAEQGAGDAIALSCRTAGAADEKDLEQQYLAAHGAVQNLQGQIERAEAELPVVTSLQERIDTANSTVNALEQLCAALAESKFVAEAVSRRVQALLYQASDILFTISSGHYRFAPDFRILDLDTTAERDVKTLSGGETFLASLALALAVVELASNATGHIEALFLDEGFGTLDTTSLRDALTALTGHSTTGRLVTVISHMRSIAESAEHVLVVERTLTTSRTHWADAEEKERVINDDLGRGLLE